MYRNAQTSGSSSSGSTYDLRMGWLLIDGRVMKAMLACVVAVMLMT